jgi:hypothetical protein
MHVETIKAYVGFGQADVRGGIARLSGDCQIEVLDGVLSQNSDVLRVLTRLIDSSN